MVLLSPLWSQNHRESAMKERLIFHILFQWSHFQVIEIFISVILPSKNTFAVIHRASNQTRFGVVNTAGTDPFSQQSVQSDRKIIKNITHNVSTEPIPPPLR